MRESDDSCQASGRFLDLFHFSGLPDGNPGITTQGFASLAAVLGHHVQIATFRALNSPEMGDVIDRPEQGNCQPSQHAGNQGASAKGSSGQNIHQETAEVLMDGLANVAARGANAIFHTKLLITNNC